MPFDNEIKQKIEGATFDECKEKLFKKYGHDYRIENKETIIKHAGLLGLRQKEITVVTYTVTHKKVYDNSETYYREEQKKQEEIEKLEANRKEILKQQKDAVMASTIKELSKQLEEVNKKLSDMDSDLKSNNAPVHDSISKIEDLLAENEFTLPYIRMITEKIRTEFSLEELDDFKRVQRRVVEWIGESIQIAPERTVRPPHVIIIVGPTGVGKTTTIAKLASNTILEAKSKQTITPEICIVTIDTMRVGALEQLAKFGEILEKNVLKAENSDDVSQIYEEYKEHVDYIFIDTSGYSPNDSTHISEMKNILDVKMNPTIYLSVSASTKSSDLHNIFRNYEPFDYESVIVTKCDETKQFGNIISVLWERHKSISYITDGQRVPRNIRRADVIDILKNLNGFDIDRVNIENKFGEK